MKKDINCEFKDWLIPTFICIGVGLVMALVSLERKDFFGASYGGLLIWLGFIIKNSETKRQK